jgi:hypothetical protein
MLMGSISERVILGTCHSRVALLHYLDLLPAAIPVTWGPQLDV